MLKLTPHHIACFGEVVWDVFPDEKRPGGSPGNFAYHCQKLQNEVSFISRVGADEEGAELVDFLQEKGLPTDLVQRDEDFPTGKVLVHGPPEAPYYTIVENSAWDHIESSPQFLERIDDVDAFCFATLTQRSSNSAASLNKILQSFDDDVLKVLDINLRPPFYTSDTILNSLSRASLVKMNEEELEIVSNLLDKENLISWIFESFRAQLICITKGEDGAILTDGSSTWSQDAHVQENSDGDTVGVGDAFLAALTSSILNKASYLECLNFASRYASEVARHKGAMPDIIWIAQ